MPFRNLPIRSFGETTVNFGHEIAGQLLERIGNCSPNSEPAVPRFGVFDTAVSSPA